MKLNTISMKSWKLASQTSGSSWLENHEAGPVGEHKAYHHANHEAFSAICLFITF